MDEPLFHPTATAHRSLVIPAAITLLLALFAVRYMVEESKRVS